MRPAARGNRRLAVHAAAPAPPTTRTIARSRRHTTARIAPAGRCDPRGEGRHPYRSVGRRWGWPASCAVRWRPPRRPRWRPARQLRDVFGTRTSRRRRSRSRVPDRRSAPSRSPRTRQDPRPAHHRARPIGWPRHALPEWWRLRCRTGPVRWKRCSPGQGRRPPKPGTVRGAAWPGSPRSPTRHRTVASPSHELPQRCQGLAAARATPGRPVSAPRQGPEAAGRWQNARRPGRGPCSRRSVTHRAAVASTTEWSRGHPTPAGSPAVPRRDRGSRRTSRA